jgi:iron complex outermembrane receptor protein
MPDLLEQRADWRYRATNFSPPLNGATDGFFYPSARAPGNVNAEKMLSREIGYLGNFPQYGLLVDAKVFDDRLSNLLSEKLQVFSFAPTNTNRAHLRGSEVQLTYEPNTRWMLYLAYSYLDNDASTVLEQTQYARHSGAFGVSRSFTNDWRATLAFYG